MGRRVKDISSQLAPMTTRPRALEADELVANAKLLMSLNRYELASGLVAKLQSIDPANVEGLLLQADLQLANEDHGKAIHTLLSASYQLPDNPNIYWLLAKLHARAGQDHLAISALHRHVTLKPKSHSAMLRLAALYSESALNDHAAYWRKKALQSAPFQASSSNLEGEKKLSVLILKTSEDTLWKLNRKTFQPHMAEGHNNLSDLLDRENIEICSLFVDVLDKSPEVVRKLPKVNLVYNGITDAERCADSLKKAQKLCDRLGVPVVNSPKAVLAASREGNYDRFKEHPDVILPKSVKLESTQKKARDIVEQVVNEYGMQLPVIIRLAGFQGGKFMHKVDDPNSHDFSELDAELQKQQQDVYVIQYHEFGYHDENMPHDMLYLKYRAFLIGGKLYPAHLRGDVNQYKVHINNKIFDICPWLENLEDHFLRDPVDYFGGDNWQKLEKALFELGLDYVGVDFGVEKESIDEGKILIFEANASMRNWPTLRNDTPHVIQAWQNNLNAVHEHFCRKVGISPWKFVLPQIGKNEVELTGQSIVSFERSAQGEVVEAVNVQGEALVKPASLTKVMLSMLVIDNVENLEEHIEVIEDDIVGGSGNNLLSGDTLSWRDILHNMLMASSDSAANVASRHLGCRLMVKDGATPQEACGRGVQALNEKAKQLSMLDTHFTNPSGLDSADMKSTAHDMAKMGLAALNYSALLFAWGKPSHTIQVKGKTPRRMTIKSTVKPLVEGQVGVLGGKTGTLPDGTVNLMLHTQSQKGSDRITVLMQVGGDRWAEMKKTLSTLNEVEAGKPVMQAGDSLALRLTITGKVQGIGYRRWFAEQVESRNIYGWVRNLSDGSVEAVIHGPEDTLQSLLDEVPKGPEGCDVTGLDAELWDGELPEGVQVLADAVR